MKRSGVALTLAFILSSLAPVAVRAGTTTVHKSPHGKTVVHKSPHGKTVVHTGPRGHVVVHQAFPIRRALPLVVVRPPRVAIRVAPRVFIAPIVFRPVVVVTRPVATAVVWHQIETFEAADEWTEVALDVNRAGSRLYFEIADGPARVSFAEVVYGDGETQVVDFADQPYSPGYYTMLTLDRPRTIDHVRVVAFADGAAAHLSFHLAL